MELNAKAEFVCENGCGRTFPLSQVIYKCPECHALLSVRHDVDALAAHSGQQWRTLFDRRYGATNGIHASGVWGKKEWVLPQVEDQHVVSMAEGRSSLVAMNRYGAQLGVPQFYMKNCGNSHTGSFKDLGMTVLVSMVRQMIADGADIRAIACASTGDTSAALAAYCAAAGVRAVVLLPKGKITTAQLVQPLAHGATVLALDTDFDGCMKMVQRLTKEPSVYLANSMNSLRIEGQKTVAIEIVQQLSWDVPDWIVIPGGNLGNVSALAAGFDLMLSLGLITKRPRLCVAQAQEANPLYQSFLKDFAPLVPMTAGATEASAIRIGNPVSFDRAVKALRRYEGVVEQASESELAQASARADRSGAYTCPHTGVALAAFEKLVAKKVISSTDTVVVVSTASGLKFTQFKVRYHDNAISRVESTHANTPIDVPNDFEKVRSAVLGSLSQ